MRPRLELLGAGEIALRARALANILQEADEFDLQTFHADETSPLEWEAAAGTTPFMGEFRTIIVRNIKRAAPEDFAFGTLPETARLVLVSDEEGGDDTKKDKNLTAWAKVVKKAGGVVTEFKVTESEFKERIKAEFQRLGKTISSSASDLLKEMTGASLSRALEETEKLDLFTGERKEISESDIRAVVLASREWNIWRMLDSLVSNQVGEALRQLTTLVGSGVKADEAANRHILPMITRQLRLLWQARVCIEAGCEPANAPDSSASPVWPAITFVST